MSNVNLKCKNCGAAMQVELDSKTITCTHCGTTYLLSEILGGEDAEFLSSTQPEKISEKIEFKDAIKRGETMLFKAKYLKAEEAFKLAISLDEKNFQGYMGVVKAKTKNLNALPENEDYKYYAEQALKLAGIDDENYVKGELEKLDALKAENEKLSLQKKKGQQKRKTLEENRRIKANFFSKLAYFLTGLIAVVLLVGIVVSILIKDKDKTPPPTTIEISSASEFLNFAKSEDYLDSTIILKSNIDLGGQKISPIGSSKFFSGEFRGNGFAVSNFVIEVTSTKNLNCVGLFAKLDKASISGLIIKNAKIVISPTGECASELSAGLIAGLSQNSEISNCAADDQSKIEIVNSKSSTFVGGLVGQAVQTKLKLCYSNAGVSVSETANLKENHFVGGLAGYLNDSSITASYSSAVITENINSSIQTKLFVGGLAGSAKLTDASSNISNSFFAGTVSLNLNQFVSHKIATTSNFDGNIDANRVYSNYSLFDSNIEVSGEEFAAENFTDWTAEKQFTEIFESEAELTQKIGEKFSSEYWTDTGTTTPKLKIEEKTAA